MEKLNLSTDQQQLMTYFRQGVISETQVLPSMARTENANELTLQDRKHALLDFLCRPIDVYRGTWTTDKLANSELIPLGLSFPDLFYKNAQYQEKMRGFVGLRGNIKIRILLNAQKMQQGILMAYWMPNAVNLATKSELIRGSLAGKSGLGHVFINCEGGTQQTIDIPYVNQHVFYNATTNQGTYGKFYITVLCPLRSPTTGDSVGIRVQAWMEAPELEYPTGTLPVLTQGLEEENMHEKTCDPPSNGADVTIPSLIKDFKNFSYKPSYIAHTAGNILQLAGYQKPTNHTGICRTSLQTNPYMANFGGEAMSHKLALASNNELMPLPSAGGSYADEMNINHICQIPTFYKTFQIDPANAENYVLFADNIHPSKFVPSNTVGVYNSSFLGYVSASFGQWRGSLKYTFMCAKTTFHSGTIRVSFIPGTYAPFANPTVLPTGVQLDRCYQQTYELRDTTEFSFTVPYVSTRPFLNVINSYSEGEQTASKFNYSTGVIVVDVFIPVRAPTTVTQLFDIAVFVSGGDDLTFANPAAPNIFPYFGTTPVGVQLRKSIDEQKADVNTQGLGFDEQHDRVEAMESSNDMIGSATPKFQLSASALCTGEIISSIKNLMGRMGTYVSVTDQVLLTERLQVAPFDFQAPLTPSEYNIAFNFDYIDYFSYLYAYYRGGVRLSLDPGYDGAYPGNVHVKMRSTLNNGYPVRDIPRAASVVYTTQMRLNPYPTVVVKPDLEGLINVEVPYYSLTPITPALVKEQTQNQVEESNYPFPLVDFFNNNSSVPDITWLPTIFRACSDDFRFQYLLGPPQVVFTQYSVIPPNIGSQFFRVSYRNQPVSKIGDVFNGLFGGTYTIAPTPSQSLRFPNQFLANAKTGTKLFLMPKRFYEFNQTATGNFIEFVNPYNSNVKDNLFCGSATIRSATITNVLSKYTALGTVADSVPDPPASFELETMTFQGAVSFKLASWGTATYAFKNGAAGVSYALPKPLMVGEPTGTASYAIGFKMLPQGYEVFFLRTSDAVAVYRVDNQTFLGYFILELITNTGFSTNTFCPTLVEEM